METKDISKSENYEISSENANFNSGENEKISFIMPEINRDQQIFLGQSIIALIGVNMPDYFKEEDNKENVGLMFIDILKHYNISIEDLYKMDLIENKLPADFHYELQVKLDYKILHKSQI